MQGKAIYNDWTVQWACQVNIFFPAQLRRVRE